MSFDRLLLPDPASYFDNRGQKIVNNRGKRFRTNCHIHGGDGATVSVLRDCGGFYCFGCGAKGGDVLSYEMQVTGAEFVDAAKALGAWVDDGRGPTQRNSNSFSPRHALLVMAFESTLTAIAAGNVANGVSLTDIDRARLRVAANRINTLVEVFA
jgi:hypothetical protein